MGNQVYVFTSKRLGHGADDLGEILIKGFFRTLAKAEPAPNVLIFLNSGVEVLVIPEVLETLEAMHAQGVKILACGTCLDYFQLREQVKPEWASNMAEIVGNIANAAKVVNF